MKINYKPFKPRRDNSVGISVRNPMGNPVVNSRTLAPIGDRIGVRDRVSKNVRGEVGLSIMWIVRGHATGSVRSCGWGAVSKEIKA